MRRATATGIALATLVLAGLLGACTSDDGGGGGGVDLTYKGTITAPDFPAGLDWVNVRRPLSLADARGKVVLLDFWTQGCINCIHIFGDLERLEAEFGDDLVVVGVHSAKFSREGKLDAIRQAVQRYQLTHPVVRDTGFAVWNSYVVNAWPTTVLIDPRGKIVDQLAGEGVYDHFRDEIDTMVREYGAAGLLDDRSLDDVLSVEHGPPSVLSFPGRVLADPSHGRLFIADSNHHRILQATLDGKLTAVYGSGTPGRRDGPGRDAQLDRPQGLSLSPDGHLLYVADLENHAVRVIDLDEATVRTVAGTGEQGFENPTHGAPALDTPLSSPWDVLVDPNRPSRVVIAMSGQHQLWELDVDAGVVKVLAGSRREGIDDGPPLQASLAQPSALATDGTTLWFTDPESSAVRALPLDGAGPVETLVGTGLFDFGDTDGDFDVAQLQHPLGLAYHDGRLYVADTYNHRIKVIDVGSRRIDTLAGDGRAGWRDGTGPDARLAEPSGLSIAGGRAFVADTNNHVIRTVDLASGAVGSLRLSGLDLALPSTADGPEATTVRLPAVESGPGGGSVLDLTVDVPAGYTFNDLGPFAVRWTSSDPDVVAVGARDRYTRRGPTFPQAFELSLRPGDAVLRGDLTAFYCRKDEEELCLVRHVLLEVPVHVEAGTRPLVEVRYTLPALDI